MLTTSDWQLVHARMGHLNAASVKMLFDRNMVLGLHRPVSGDQTELEQCKGCLEGKTHRQSIPKVATHRASDPLQVVHTDLCGPMSEPSMGSGALYFITFIDDFSRHTSVFLLRTKDGAIDAFRKYKTWAENYTGYKIKTLRSDGGGEYMSTHFKTLLSIYGIDRQVTVPRTPQQNGVAERANRTIMEAARSMLHQPPYH
jgi:transposase InsO family protein